MQRKVTGGNEAVRGEGVKEVNEKKESCFWISDCGEYIARHVGNCHYDVMTVDGRQCWLAMRYQPAGWKDKDKRFTYPEFDHMTTDYTNSDNGKKEVFELGFADLDQSKKIKPLTGNCIIKKYKARFSRKLNIKRKPVIS
ncbi:MAG: hypothetical protein ABFD76_11050 [Smithella sp.]